jgi:hypothetical protein
LDFLRFFLAYTDEVEVTLIFELDEDSNSVLSFELICDDEGFVVYSKDRFSVASPARVLVLRPASPELSVFGEFVDIGAVVAIVFDVGGAEVVLKDVVGHVGAIIIVDHHYLKMISVQFVVVLVYIRTIL